MPASPRPPLLCLALLAMLGTGCDRKAASPPPPPPVVLIPAPVAEDPLWAFQPLPATIPVPEIQDADWPHHPLDHFILAPLEQHGLAPSPEVDPATWLRRATLQLTGLPPTPTEIASFASALAGSDDPEAVITATADRLLASPAYGEQCATHWLNEIRYTDFADTASDRLNTQWPYRDRVVDAFNANLPYNEFLVAQLAGDLLDAPDPGQLLATAFLRAHPFDHGDAVTPGEAIHRHASARVDTLGRAVLGLPLECARCHDDPDSPTTRADYYSLLAFFASLSESGHGDNPDVIPAPTFIVPTDDQLDQLYTTSVAEATTEKLLRGARLDGEKDFLAWHAAADKLPLIPDLVGAFTFDDKTPKSPNRAITGTGFADRGTLPTTKGISGRAVLLDGKRAITVPDIFKIERWNAWTFSFWIRDSARSPDPVVLLAHTRGLRTNHHGIDLLLDDGHLTARISRDWPGNAIGIETSAPVVPRDTWTHLTWSYDGSNTTDGLRLFINGQPAPTRILASQLWGDPHAPGQEPDLLLLGARSRDRGFKDGAIDDLLVFSRALTSVEIAHLHDSTSLPAALRGEPTDALRDYYFSSIHPESRQLRLQIAVERKATLAAETPAREIAIARELRRPRHVTIPGTGTRAPRALPDFLPQIDKPRPNRLTLARHLTSSDHPLTARAVVNRTWARFFHRGLVPTTRNLGPGGAAPSHPDLLDWLARDFVAHDWNLKRLCKQIVLSSTYRQESARRNDLLARDPDNHLLARFPAHPLPPLTISELLRSASGQLDPTRGGPPTPGPRRALYTTWSPPRRSHDTGAPSCPLNHQATPTLLDTLTPPDAETILATSRTLARNIRAHPGEDADRIHFLFTTLAGRTPSEKEQQVLADLLTELHTKFSSAHAPQLIQPHSTPELPDPELASWTALSQSILQSHLPLWIR